MSKSRLEEKLYQPLLNSYIFFAVSYNKVKYRIIEWIRVIIHYIYVILQEFLVDGNVI